MYYDIVKFNRDKFKLTCLTSSAHLCTDYRKIVKEKYRSVVSYQMKTAT